MRKQTDSDKTNDFCLKFISRPVLAEILARPILAETLTETFYSCRDFKKLAEINAGTNSYRDSCNDQFLPRFLPRPTLFDILAGSDEETEAETLAGSNEGTRPTLRWYSLIDRCGVCN